MSKQFEHKDSGDKLHMQTLAAIAHYDRDALYPNVAAFRVMSKIGQYYSEIEKFYHRMMFNLVARNYDEYTNITVFLWIRTAIGNRIQPTTYVIHQQKMDCSKPDVY